MQLVLTSILAFASTNIDDIFLLALFFGDKRYSTKHIYVGQFFGILALIAVSLVGALIGHWVDSKYVGLLGLFPIYLGLKEMWNWKRAGEEEEALENEARRNVQTGMFHVAAVTFANGGDNIGTYIPLFASLTAVEKTIMIALFLAMVFIWLRVAQYLAFHPLMANNIVKYGHWVTPFVLVLLGLLILKGNGSFELL